MKSLTLLIILFLPLFRSEAQTPLVIQLTNKATPKKTLVLKSGDRIRYFSGKEVERITGTLQEVSTESIKVADKTVMLSDLEFIGKRSSGTGFGTFAMAVLGGSLIGSVLRPDDSGIPPCYNCTVTVENEGLGVAGDVLAVTGGLGLVVLAVHIGTKNSQRDLEEWSLEIIPSDQVKKKR